MIRVRYAAAAVALFAVEAAIAVFVHDRLIRPYVGDALVVALVYLVLRAVTPLRIVTGIATAFAIACAVEVSQGFGLIDRLGLGGSAVAHALLGSHFDPSDFVAYAIGALATLAIEAWRTRAQVTL